MHDYVKVMQEMENKFTSTNSNAVERTTITKEQFDVIKGELSRLQSACHDSFDTPSPLPSHKE